MNDRREFGQLSELQRRFVELAAQIPESPQREALSVLHGMIQEIGRTALPGAKDGSTATSGRTEMTLERVADLYKSAPGMSGEAVNEPLPVGTRAPDFALRDADGRTVSLDDFRGRAVVLVFYPLDWSPTCSDQLSLYQADIDEFERLNTAVVGISVDSIYSHGAWAAVRGLTIPLLADFEPKGEVARRYRVYRDADGFSERALYVIDAEGIIRFAHVSPQLDHIPDIYDLFGVLAEVGESDERAPASSATGDPAAGVGGAA